MEKTDKEVLELCKSWFEDIMERSERLTSGNVSHGSRAIYGTAKNCVEYIDEHLHNSNRWKPSDAQMEALKEACDKRWEPDGLDPLYTLYEYLKKLTE